MVADTIPFLVPCCTLLHLAAPCSTFLELKALEIGFGFALLSHREFVTRSEAVKKCACTAGQEVERSQKSRVAAGRWQYIPRDWWHHACRAIQCSVSTTITQGARKARVESMFYSTKKTDGAVICSSRLLEAPAKSK